MAVDRGYGSGKPLSATQSRNRRRAAAGQLSKSKRGAAATIKSQRAKLAASPLGQFADTLLGFALPTGKVASAARNLINSGRSAQALPLVARVAAKAIGGNANAEKALELVNLELKGESAAKIFAKANNSRILENAPKAWKKITGPKGEITRGNAARNSAESLFPRLPSGGGVPGTARTFDKYYDALDEGANRFIRSTKKKAK